MSLTATAENRSARMDKNIRVDVQNETSAASAPSERHVADCVLQAVTAVRGIDGTACELSVRFVDEEEGRSLNRRFRAMDSATNVLSFAADRPAGLPNEHPELLGDIVICGPVVEREAREQGKSAAEHWEHLLIHGALHLLGLDHQDDRQAAEMELLEIKILAERGISDPYDSPIG